MWQRATWCRAGVAARGREVLRANLFDRRACNLPRAASRAMQSARRRAVPVSVRRAQRGVVRATGWRR
eukprot:6444710-Lingulodinium_polyedra.AAC.1